MIDVAQAKISATQAATEAANPCTNQPFHTLLTADDVQNPVVKQDPTTGQYTVSFTLTDAAKARFSDFTAKHTGKQIAVELDGKLVSIVPVTPATSMDVVVTGPFTNHIPHVFAD